MKTLIAALALLAIPFLTQAQTLSTATTTAYPGGRWQPHELAFDPANVNSVADYRSVQSGWYVQGIYQFMPRWRLGLRTERLDAGNPDYGSNAGLYALSDYRPRKSSLMVDFNPSEFSRVRLQFAQDRSRQGASDNQLFLQYQMSLGAHGAHGY